MTGEPRRRTAGAFDVRVIIGALFLVYGIVLTVMGATTGASQLAKSAGVNINLLTGIGMVIFALLFGAWAWLRPIIVAGPTRDEESGHR